MSLNTLSHPAAAMLRPRQEKRLVSARAQALAERLSVGAEALAALATTLTDGQWRTAIPHDGRTVGRVVHHVATVYPIGIQLARTLAAGKPIEGVTLRDIHAMNVSHAKANAAVTRDEAVALLRKNSRLAALAIRALSDEELDRALPASLYGHAPVTCQFVLEDHAVRHSYHHLARIQAVLGVR
jgi:hypothetical protein